MGWLVCVHGVISQGLDHGGWVGWMAGIQALKPLDPRSNYRPSTPPPSGQWYYTSGQRPTGRPEEVYTGLVRSIKTQTLKLNEARLSIGSHCNND